VAFMETFAIIGALSLFAIAISLFAIVIALVPTLLRFGRALKQAEILFESLNRQVEPLCHSVTDAANELRSLSAALGDKVEKTEEVIRTAQLSAETLLTTSRMCKESLRPFISGLGGFTAGVRAFSHFLGASRKKTKGGRDEQR